MQELDHFEIAVVEDQVDVETAEAVGREDRCAEVRDMVCDLDELAVAGIEVAVAMGLDLVVALDYTHSPFHSRSAYLNGDYTLPAIVVVVEVAAAFRLAYHHSFHFGSAASSSWSASAFDSYSAVRQRRSLSVIALKEGHQKYWRMRHLAGFLADDHIHQVAIHSVGLHCNLPSRLPAVLVVVVGPPLSSHKVL